MFLFAVMLFGPVSAAAQKRFDAGRRRRPRSRRRWTRSCPAESAHRHPEALLDTDAGAARAAAAIPSPRRPARARFLGSSAFSRRLRFPAAAGRGGRRRSRRSRAGGPRSSRCRRSSSANAPAAERRRQRRDPARAGGAGGAAAEAARHRLPKAERDGLASRLRGARQQPVRSAPPGRERLSRRSRSCRMRGSSRAPGCGGRAARSAGPAGIRQRRGRPRHDADAARFPGVPAGHRAAPRARPSRGALGPARHRPRPASRSPTVCIDEPGLTLPHPGLHRRNFVLYPLSEIAAELWVPGLARVGRLRDRVSPVGIKRLAARGIR